VTAGHTEETTMKCKRFALAVTALCAAPLMTLFGGPVAATLYADGAVEEQDEREATPPDARVSNGIIGIGGGAGGPRGGRFVRRNLRSAGGTGTEKPLQIALGWLAAHQDAEGNWDCDGFMKHDPKDDRCTGAGQPNHDVGVTGLALLAFMGDGSTTRIGPHKDAVTRGLKWLRGQQDQETGLFGVKSGHTFLYDHAIASLAMCEAYYFSKSPLLKHTAQKSVDYIHRARNPYMAWRYDVPPVGDNDTSVTSWMVFALSSAKDAGLEVEEKAFQGALAWLDEATDPETGRIGYDAKGSRSSRVPGANVHFSPEHGEAMTAAGLLCRFFLGQNPKDDPIMLEHADLLLRKPPEWDPEKHVVDMYYWYYGSYAMFQMGGRHWKGWNKAMKAAVLRSQRTGGAAKGSWDPVGPWGYSGGRVYSTAMMALCLEVYFRYARIVGER